MVGRNVEISRREMLAALVAASIVFPSLSAAADPLPSWNVGTLKGAVVEFVTEVTTPGSAELVPARSGSPSLINGTLWVEKPMTQRVKALAPVPQASESFVESIVGVRTGSGLTGWRSYPPLSTASESARTTPGM